MLKGKILKEAILVLIKLQGIDIQIKDIDHKLHTAPKALDGIKKRLSQAKRELALKKERLEGREKEKKGAEWELEDCEAKTRKSQQRIMEIKTNKEYQALLAEIEELKALVSQWEERILELMEEIDSIKRDITESESKVKELEKHQASEQRRLEHSLKELGEKLTVLKQQREEVAKNLPKDLLERYDFIYRRRNGNAIVAVNDDGVCEGCHMRIPPQQYNELLRMDRLMFCSTCQRIIYWKGLIKETTEVK